MLARCKVQGCLEGDCIVGANDPQAPVTQGWLRVSHRKVDPSRSRPEKPYHPHDGRLPVVPGAVYDVDVEIWPTSVVVPAGYSLALTLAGKDFERAETQGLVKGSGIFLHDDPTDRPPEIFGGTNTIHTGAGLEAKPGRRGERLQRYPRRRVATRVGRRPSSFGRA